MKWVNNTIGPLCSGFFIQNQYHNYIIMENSILIRNITVKDLQELVRSVFREELQILLPQKGEPKYMTRKEVAAFLKISLPTLHNYTKAGIVKGFRIGTRVLYKMEDIEQTMKSIEISRYRRGI
jgi:hypothetical protein